MYFNKHDIVFETVESWAAARELSKHTEFSTSLYMLAAAGCVALTQRIVSTECRFDGMMRDMNVFSSIDWEISTVCFVVRTTTVHDARRGVELNFKFFAGKHRVSRSENTVLLHKPAAVSLQLNELCTRWGRKGETAPNEFIIVLNRLLNSLPLLFCTNILTFRLNTSASHTRNKYVKRN